MKLILLLFGIAALISCDIRYEKPVTEEELLQILENEAFDSDVVKNPEVYVPLKDFLRKYSDTIISFKNSQNYVTEHGTDNESHTALQPQDCYSFFEVASDGGITGIPEHLKTELNEIYNDIGDSGISSFQICRNGAIEMKIRTFDKENDIFIWHYVIWNNADGQNGYNLHKTL